MTNGANYNRGKLHHSLWHSDIRTFNQLNTSPGRLSRPFHTKQYTKEKRSQSNIVDLLKTNMPNQSMCFATAFPMRIPVPIPILFPRPFSSVPRPFPRPLPIPILIAITSPLPSLPRPFPKLIPIIAIAAQCFQIAGFGSGFVKQSVSISVVGTYLKSISPSQAISAAGYYLVTMCATEVPL